ncbi:glycosyltransferase [Psychroserpens sp. S379A]|uniref:glycosyltransferase n=1 Tax=Psychroserpens sp. S379A TaxID=3415137 RepID=UPI003C7A9AA9
MKILLVGEYSRLHNSLKEGLIELGHDVVLVGNGDTFKNYPIDINIDNSFSKKYIPSILRKIFFRLLKIDLADYETIYKFKKALPRLTDFDIVQLINEDALCIKPTFQQKLLKTLFKQNKNIFLLCSGQDYVSISYALKNKLKYSILTPYLENSKLKKKYHFSLKYTSKPYYNLYKFIKNNTIGVIATDIDYHIPYQGKSNYLGLIPNPINIDKITFEPIKKIDTIKIFHGVNIASSTQKGNIHFKTALEIISKKHPNKVEIITTYSIPYKDYIKRYNECHILLDQVYAYDQGYNALEAMAKGKVVFTGAEQEWLDYYNLEEDTVAINALPDAEKIAEKIEWLILNPHKIIEISQNARRFIEREHHYITSSKKYLDIWNSTTH